MLLLVKLAGEAPLGAIANTVVPSLEGLELAVRCPIASCACCPRGVAEPPRSPRQPESGIPRLQPWGGFKKSFDGQFRGTAAVEGFVQFHGVVDEVHVHSLQEDWTVVDPQWDLG